MKYAKEDSLRNTPLHGKNCIYLNKFSNHLYCRLQTSQLTNKESWGIPKASKNMG